MGSPFRDAWQHRQDRLGAVEGLDLALLVDTEHQRAIRRRHVKADNVADLVDEVRITGEFEGLGPVRLQAEGAPDAPDRRVRQPRLLRHRAQRPVGRVHRRRGERSLDHLCHLLVLDGPRAPRAGFVRQALDAVLDEAAAPFAHRVLVHPDLCGHRLVAKPVRATQDHAAAIGQGARHTVAPNLCFQKRPFLIAQDQGRQRPSRTARHRDDLLCPTRRAILE